MLHVSRISRPDRFTNEAMPFVNTAGTMNFSLTSSQLLDLASYQRTLKSLIATFAGMSSNDTKTPSSRADTTDLTEVCLGSGAAVVLDTSVLLLPTTTSTTTSTTTITAHLKPDPHPQQLSSSQNYPLAFVASSQVSSLLFRHTTPTCTQSPWPVLYYLRLPLNPLTHAIQCHVSARRLCPRHVSFLDRILRRLCDASPGAFMIGYSDGMSGVDAGTEVVYSGESCHSSSSSSSSSTAPHLHPHAHAHAQPQSHPSTSLPQHPQSNSHLEHITAGVSEPNSAVARHKDLGESDHQPTGLVGYIEHSLSPAIIERNHHSNSSGSNPSRVEDPLLPSAQSLKTLKDNIAAASMSSAIMNEEPTILQGRDRPGPVLSRDGLEVNETTTEVGLYDFGSMDDGEIFLDASPGLGMDDVHDTLWVH